MTPYSKKNTFRWGVKKGNMKTKLTKQKKVHRNEPAWKDAPRVYKSVEKPLRGRERLKTVLAVCGFFILVVVCFALSLMALQK